MTGFFILFMLAYVAGSVNFSILLFRVLKKEDPRTRGSGNAGATNVYRQAGLFWAVVVLLLDMGRALGVAALALFLLDTAYVTWIGLGLILGNRFPCFHGLQGGKGVANYLGFTTLITPLSALASGLAWAAVFAVFRIPFISSFAMVSVLAGGTIIAFSSSPAAVMGTLVTVILIVLCHTKNIVELIGKIKGKKEE